MKNNKGFTLVELLAVMVLLAIIVVLAAPSITKEINKSERETSELKKTRIENAIKIYAAKYYASDISASKRVPSSGQISLSDVRDDGLISFKNDDCEPSNTTFWIGTDGVYHISSTGAVDKRCY